MPIWNIKLGRYKKVDRITQLVILLNIISRIQKNVDFISSISFLLSHPRTKQCIIRFQALEITFVL